jgi:hypothetical protein
LRSMSCLDLLTGPHVPYRPTTLALTREILPPLHITTKAKQALKTSCASYLLPARDDVRCRPYRKHSLTHPYLYDASARTGAGWLWKCVCLVAMEFARASVAINKYE